MKKPWEMTDEEIRAEVKKPPGVIEDVARSAASGVGRGLVGAPGMLGDIQTLGERGAVWLRGKIAGPEEAQALAESQRRANAADPLNKIVPTSESMIQHATDAGIPGLQYEPSTTAGKIAQVGGEFVGGALPTAGAGAYLKAGTNAERGWALGKELLTQGVIPGVTSEAAGQAADRYLPEEYATGVRLATGAGASIAGGTAHNVTGPPRDVAIPGVEGNVRSAAAARVGEGIRNAGGPEAVARELRAVGPGGRLADASDNLRGQTEQLFIEPGPSQGNVRQFLTERARTMGGNEDTHLNQALNTIIEPRAANFAEQSLEMREARRNRANELYGVAERVAGDRPILQDRTLAYIDASIPDDVLAGRRAPLPEHQELMQLREQLTGEPRYQDLDRLKNILNRRLEQNYNPDLAHIRDRIVDSLSEATAAPDGTSPYRAAQRAYREDSGILEQSNAGRKFFDAKETADEFRLRWRDLSDDEQMAYRMGLREAVGAKMDMAVNDFTTGSNALRTIDNQKKLETVLGVDQARQLQDRIEGLRRQRGTVQGIASQSATAGRTRGRTQIADPTAKSDLPPLSRVQTTGGIASLAAETAIDKTLGGYLANRRRARADVENVDQARMLTQDLDALPPEERLAMLRRLHDVYGEQGQRGLPANRLLLALQSMYQTERSRSNR